MLKEKGHITQAAEARTLRGVNQNKSLDDKNLEIINNPKTSLTKKNIT